MTTKGKREIAVALAVNAQLSRTPALQSAHASADLRLSPRLRLEDRAAAERPRNAAGPAARGTWRGRR
jgi:hypothetical protein